MNACEISRAARVGSIAAGLIAAMASCASGRPENAVVGLEGARTVQHALWSDGRMREDYYRFEQAPLAGELVQLVANTADMYALEDPLTVDRAIRKFANNKGASIDDELHRLDGAQGLIFWRAFSVAASGRNCAGFASTGGEDAFDPDNRPASVTFGYACTSGALTAAEVDRFLVGLEPVTLSADDAAAEGFIAANAAAPVDVRKAVPDWPLDLAQHYNNY